MTSAGVLFSTAATFRSVPIRACGGPRPPDPGTRGWASRTGRIGPAGSHGSSGAFLDCCSNVNAALTTRPDLRRPAGLGHHRSMQRQQEYVLRTVEERGVRLVRLWFTDVNGQLKSFAIAPPELEKAFDEGMHFDGSSIDGYSRVQESDVLARPDATTFELLPWTISAGGENSARMFC